MAESTTQNVLVRRLCVETADVRSLELVAADGQPLQAFEAGAHIDVHLGDGLIRQYSLINTTGTDGSYRIAVKLEPNSRGGSERMHRLAEGSALTVSLPRNNFPLDPEAGHTMLLAGGIGITPLLGMAYRLMEEDASFSLDYFARSREALAFGEEIGGGPFTSRSRFHLGLDGEGTRAELAGQAGFRTAGYAYLRLWPGALHANSSRSRHRKARAGPAPGVLRGRSLCWLPSRPVHSG